MSSLYLLDASTLITANNHYFSMDRIPQYWNWLLDKAREEIVKIPREIYDEIKPSSRPKTSENPSHSQTARSDLFTWIRRADVQEQLILDEQIDGDIHDQVLREGYGENLDEGDFFKIGKDSFLIAYAKKRPERIVVTKELSRPSRTKGNRKIPDVCNDLKIKCIDDYEFQRQCDFRIS